VDNQRDMLIHVLQGERERAKDNWSLGRFTLAFEPAPRGIPRVASQFEIDANGILHVLARDLKTGKQKIVEMNSAVDVDDAAVQKMVEESVEYAFDDLAARRWWKPGSKPSSSSNATRKGLADCADEINDDYKIASRVGFERRRGSCRRRESRNKNRRYQQLQAACATLDEVTKPLAEILMDKAMEALLRKRGVIQ